MSASDLAPKVQRKEGYLYKLSRKRFLNSHMYQKRYFVLDMNKQQIPTMKYYRNKQDFISGKLCLGQFTIESIESISSAPDDKRFDVTVSNFYKYPNGRRIVFRNQRTFDFRAKTLELTQEWVEDLTWTVQSWNETQIFRTLSRGAEYIMYSDQFGVGSNGAVGQRAIHMRFVPAELSGSLCGVLCWCFLEDYMQFRERRQLDTKAKSPFSRQRSIPLAQLKGFDVGRVSGVLQRSTTDDITDNCCFSVFTSNQVYHLSAPTEDEVQALLCGVRMIKEVCSGKGVVQKRGSPPESKSDCGGVAGGVVDDVAGGGGSPAFAAAAAADLYPRNRSLSRPPIPSSSIPGLGAPTTPASAHHHRWSQSHHHPISYRPPHHPQHHHHHYPYQQPYSYPYQHDLQAYHPYQPSSAHSTYPGAPYPAFHHSEAPRHPQPDPRDYYQPLSIHPQSYPGDSTGLTSPAGDEGFRIPRRQQQQPPAEDDLEPGALYFRPEGKRRSKQNLLDGTDPLSPTSRGSSAVVFSRSDWSSGSVII